MPTHHSLLKLSKGQTFLSALVLLHASHGTMPCRILSSPSSPLVFLLLFISINGHPANSPPTSFCPNSTTCGGQLITYPFWVQNPQYHCDYEGFMLICKDDQTLILSLGSHEYNVASIDYPNQTISLVDTDVVDAGFCPMPRHNLTFEDKSFLDYTSSDINLTFFLNCSFGKDLSKNQITCFPGSDGNSSYIFTDDDLPTAEEYGLAQRCQGIVVVPMLYDQEIIGAYWDHLVGRLLMRGFQLHWPDETCEGCKRSGRRCGYNQTTSTSWAFGCFCSDGMRDHNCGTLSSNKSFSGPLSSNRTLSFLLLPSILSRFLSDGFGKV
uniref:LEAF RUST 10 DISEASE-RESISTANCE LOCUS RECEPTOR-LIKE PROTEIN KINASE-like 1.2 n=1 Tax=Elaeis guineensis var. tenera TaxID=51953 RepID=A0A8N4F047_ELAGV|nr:LEAF RUST 10 DISEASE-RESISTANCE LOCUS RECEPTOR-LIKE PROTEIN KINASE-like 1.2 [Elaeis guineensis]